MRNLFVTAVLASVLLAGCSDDDSDVLESDTSMSEIEEVAPLTQADLVARYAGTDFISIEDLSVGETADGDIALGKWLVSFTADVVSWSYSDVVEVGTYSVNADGEAVADFGSRQLVFTGDEGSLELDSQTYVELSESAFDSQDSLTSYLDGAQYVGVEPDVESNSDTGAVAPLNAGVSFDGNQFTLIIQDTAQAGTYSYVNDSSLEFDFTSRQSTVYFLKGDRLLIDNVEYRRDTSAQIDSQASLVAYLEGSSYRSVDLQSVGETGDGSEASGYWYVDFTSDMFIWTYEDIQQAGSYSFTEQSTFAAVLGDRELIVEIEGGDIIWDEVRYNRE